MHKRKHVVKTFNHLADQDHYRPFKRKKLPKNIGFNIRLQLSNFAHFEFKIPHCELLTTWCIDFFRQIKISFNSILWSWCCIWKQTQTKFNLLLKKLRFFSPQVFLDFKKALNQFAMLLNSVTNVERIHVSFLYRQLYFQKYK